MSGSQPTKQPEGMDKGVWSSPVAEEDGVEESISGSSSSASRQEQPPANPPPSKIPSIIGKEVAVPTTHDQVQAILPTSGPQFEVFANLVRERLVSQDQHLTTTPRRELLKEG